MEIKTGEEIYAEALDIQWYNKKSGYDDETTKNRKAFENKKWVAVDDRIIALKKLKLRVHNFKVGRTGMFQPDWKIQILKWIDEEINTLSNDKGKE